jgi:hypothetical protein
MMPRRAVSQALLRRVPNQYEFCLNRSVWLRREQGNHPLRQPRQLPPAQADQRQTTQLRRRRRSGGQQRPATELSWPSGEHLLDRRQVADILR